MVGHCIAILEPWYCIGIVLLAKAKYCYCLQHWSVIAEYLVPKKCSFPEAFGQ